MKRWSDPSQHCFACVQGIKLRFLWYLLKMEEVFGAAIGSVRPRFWQMCFPGHHTVSSSERSACRSREQSGKDSERDELLLQLQGSVAPWLSDGVELGWERWAGMFEQSAYLLVLCRCTGGRTVTNRNEAKGLQPG